MAAPRAFWRLSHVSSPVRGVLHDQLARVSRPSPTSSPWLSLLPRAVDRFGPVGFVRYGPRFYSTESKAKDDQDNAATSSSEPSSITDSSSSSSSTSAESLLQNDVPTPDDSSTSTPTTSTSSPEPEPELPSTSEARRSPASARFSTIMDNLQARAVEASQKLNDLTGYTAIEAVKQQNVTLENDLAAAQARLREARHDYKALTAARAATQREVTTLLARKDSWSPADLERFTTLYRSDHEVEARVTAASAELTEAEAREAKLSADLTAGILRRYHEEQVWSDRIRRQSTWGTWGLMGVNVLLFLVLQFVAEPWKRARLIRGVAEGEKTHWEEVRRELGEMKASLVQHKAEEQVMPLEMQPLEWKADVPVDVPAVLASIEEAPEDLPQEPLVVVEMEDGSAMPAVPESSVTHPTASWKETLADPGRWKEFLLDLGSERTIGLRMRDASLLALEGALAGATVAAGVAVLVLRRT